MIRCLFPLIVRLISGTNGLWYVLCWKDVYDNKESVLEMFFVIIHPSNKELGIAWSDEKWPREKNKTARIRSAVERRTRLEDGDLTERRVEKNQTSLSIGVTKYAWSSHLKWVLSRSIAKVVMGAGQTMLPTEAEVGIGCSVNVSVKRRDSITLFLFWLLGYEEINVGANEELINHVNHL